MCPGHDEGEVLAFTGFCATVASGYHRAVFDPDTGDAPYLAEYGTMTWWPLRLRLASEADLESVLRLIHSVAAWLQTQNTDQWARPWPNQAVRDDRVRTDLKRGKTWIAWDGETAAATITVDPDEDPRWPELRYRHPAIYIQRLMICRPYGGAGLGAELLDWAGKSSRRDHQADWMRANAWTTNKRLHDYYTGQGFTSCGFCDAADGYPSAARFQRPAAYLSATHRGLLVEVSGTR